MQTYEPENALYDPILSFYERNVLDCMVTSYDEYAAVLEDVSPDEFSICAYRTAASLVRRMRSQGKAVDLAGIYAESGENDEILDTLLSVSRCSTYSGMETSVLKVKAAAKYRRIRHALLDIVHQKPDDALLELEKIIEHERRTEQPEAGFSGGSARFLAALSTPLRDNRIATGFSKLDKTLGWLPRGSLTIIGARPSVGKTSFAINIAIRAKQAGHNVMMASLEMSVEQVFERMAAMISGVPYALINQHSLTAPQRDCVEESLKAADGYPGDFYVFDTISTVEAILSKAAKMRPTLLIVDFLQYIACEGENRARALAEVVRQFKQAARIYNIQIIVLSQLNREMEKSTSPTLAHLKESGAIEEGGDIILLLHRPGVIDACVDPSKTELLVAKNKYGHTGRIAMTFYGDTQRFREAM